jgi:hypothetical protein
VGDSAGIASLVCGGNAAAAKQRAGARRIGAALLAAQPADNNDRALRESGLQHDREQQKSDSMKTRALLAD